MVRAKVCYGLGLISKSEYQDLETISQLRNARAHGIGPADFADTHTLTLVSTLTLISSAHATVTGRNRFIACVSTLVMLSSSTSPALHTRPHDRTPISPS